MANSRPRKQVTLLDRPIQVLLSVFVVLLLGAAAAVWLGLPGRQSGEEAQASIPPVTVAVPLEQADASFQPTPLTSVDEPTDFTMAVRALFLDGAADSVPAPSELVIHRLSSAPDSASQSEWLVNGHAALRSSEIRLAALGQTTREHLNGHVPSEEDELPAWRRNAALVYESTTAPLIAVVVDDIGHSEADFVHATRLGEPVTLAILPYKKRAGEFARRARKKGFEVLVHMPMEPVDSTADPGPEALLTGLPQKELRRRLEHNLAQLEGYVGINNHMGSRFTRDAEAMELVMREVNDRGLLYLDSITVGRPIGARIAEQLRMPYATRDVFIDAEENRPFIDGQLEELERMARKHGYAVGIGHPYPDTYAALEAWLPQARARGIEFVPVSVVAALECAC